jgi:hypothetical protein
MKSFLAQRPFPALAVAVVAATLSLSCADSPRTEASHGHAYPATFTLSKALLKDKIMGGWAGQVIGCTYGGPTEFKFCGTMIQDYVPIEWDETKMEWWYTHAPGLYDDVYMDLTFVEVFQNEGLDAPASSHARAFANAEYSLWHANQAARYNILSGMEPPATGHWENNPHADDIDFQIEADFAGLMNPGMVNSASEVCDRVGHIMNYGDGWYGGVYVAAMYALSFYSDDIGFIVSEALRAIPAGSQFYQCINDVLQWHEQFPGDWKRTWFEVERKWSSDIGCPDGVFRAFNIDAKVNAAYIVIGLLYGGGDFGKTLDISTRCGQDSDCNPASAGGILGTLLGYSAIPDQWKAGLDRVEAMDFRYTTISLSETYAMGFEHAIGMISRSGGTVEGEEVVIPLQQPQPVRFEKSFDGHFPLRVVQVPWGSNQLNHGSQIQYSFTFEGNGFVVKGGSWKEDGTSAELVPEVEVRIDGDLFKNALLPTQHQARRHDVTWKYNLPEGEHEVTLRWTNPLEGYGIDLESVIIYGPEPV